MRHKDDAKKRAGEAMARDVEQTKHDVTRGRKGRDLEQDVGDTVKQGTGRAPIPPRNVPNASDEK